MSSTPQLRSLHPPNPPFHPTMSITRSLHNNQFLLSLKTPPSFTPPLRPTLARLFLKIHHRSIPQKHSFPFLPTEVDPPSTRSVSRRKTPPQALLPPFHLNKIPTSSRNTAPNISLLFLIVFLSQQLTSQPASHSPLSGR